MKEKEYKKIPYGRQWIDQADIDAVTDVLRSDFLTQGPQVPIFEQAVSDYVGSNYAVAVNSATSALHIACMALGLGKGDIVWTSPISFVASANCALYCGADVDFVDIDQSTYNISIASLKEKLIIAKANNQLPKVVIPVHLAGQSCEMKEIAFLGKEYGFKIIEDASHAIGATYQGKTVGSCEYSDICVFSFHPVKIITTGEGGMCTTNDEDLANRLTRLRSHGITRNPLEMTKNPDGAWYYQQIDLGFNYRMNDIRAALGVSQLKKLDKILEMRNNIRVYYDNILADLPLQLPSLLEGNQSAWHLYIILVDEHESNFDRRQVFERLRSNGIYVNVHYIPIYHQPYFQKMYDYDHVSFKNAESYYKRAISLPIYPGLSKSDQDRVRETILTPLGHQDVF